MLYKVSQNNKYNDTRIDDLLCMERGGESQSSPLCKKGMWSGLNANNSCHLYSCMINIWPWGIYNYCKC